MKKLADDWIISQCETQLGKPLIPVNSGLAEKKVMAEDNQDWNLFFSDMWAVLQAATRLSLFEPLFERMLQGLLNVSTVAWEWQPSPHWSVIKHIWGMREHWCWCPWQENTSWKLSTPSRAHAINLCAYMSLAFLCISCASSKCLASW